MPSILRSLHLAPALLYITGLHTNAQEPVPLDHARDGLKKAGVATARRHLFLCLGPNCADLARGQEMWDYIKRRLKDTGLPAMRTKADCLRICTRGPILVVYPEGVWYPEVTPERFEQILQAHLIGGSPIREWMIAQNDLQACPAVQQS